MGKFLKPVSNQTEAQVLYEKILKAARGATKYIFDPDLSMVDGQYVITIFTDIPDSIGDLAYDIIKKHPRANWVKANVFPGSFDWASDTYIKDQVLIYFKF